MSDKSNIEWTDATWNPVTGCTKVSAGCLNCYAEGVTKRFQWDGPFVPWTINAQRHSSEPPVYLHADRLNVPLAWRRSRKIFVNSMSDLFHEAVPDGFIYDVFLTMAAANRHTFQVLTKRPDRAAKLIPTFREAIQEDAESPGWPLPNVWMGVSVENQRNALRLDDLARTPAAVRFVSCEPLLGSLDLRQWLRIPQPNGFTELPPKWAKGSLDWVIAGGESGPNARPLHPDWARNVRDQCQEAEIPFFFKQWGEYIEVDGPHCRAVRTRKDGDYWIEPDGRLMLYNDGWLTHSVYGASIVRRVGRNAAGALLDGQEYREFPA